MTEPDDRTPLRRLFDKALAVGGNTHTFEDIEYGLSQGVFQYWGDSECGVLTQIVDYPRTRKLHIFIVAGKYALAVERYLPDLKAFAEEIGASSITAIGRRGFERIVPKIGFKPKYIAFEYNIERSQ